MNKSNLPPGVTHADIEAAAKGICADMVGDARCEIPGVLAEFGLAVGEISKVISYWDYDTKPELAIRSSRLAADGLRKTARMLVAMASTIDEWRGYAEDEQTPGATP